MRALHPVQIAYHVPDPAAAARECAARYGWGPFILFEHIPLARCLYRGAPAAFDHSSAYGQAGDVMVELITQHNPGPSALRDLYAPHETGLHHVACFVDDLASALAEQRARGLALALEAETATGTRFAMGDTSRALGHMLELYERAALAPFTPAMTHNPGGRLPVSRPERLCLFLDGQRLFHHQEILHELESEPHELHIVGAYLLLRSLIDFEVVQEAALENKPAKSVHVIACQIEHLLSLLIKGHCRLVAQQEHALPLAVEFVITVDPLIFPPRCNAPLLRLFKTPAMVLLHEKKEFFVKDLIIERLLQCGLSDRIVTAIGRPVFIDTAAFRNNEGTGPRSSFLILPSFVADGEVFWGYDAGAMFLDYLREPAAFLGGEMGRVGHLPAASLRRSG